MWPENRVIPSDREFDEAVFNVGDCPRCGGRGWLPEDSLGNMIRMEEWLALSEDGRTRATCPECRGFGTVRAAFPPEHRR